jgi:hypothetical protein
MALFPEKEPQVKPVEERSEQINPLTIERKEVVTPIPSQFTAQVNDAQGKPMITTPTNQKVNIQLPKPAEVLEENSKGDVGEALTWWARLWLRLFKKYVYTNK